MKAWPLRAACFVNAVLSGFLRVFLGKVVRNLEVGCNAVVFAVLLSEQKTFFVNRVLLTFYLFMHVVHDVVVRVAKDLNTEKLSTYIPTMLACLFDKAHTFAHINSADV